MPNVGPGSSWLEHGARMSDENDPTQKDEPRHGNRRALLVVCSLIGIAAIAAGLSLIASAVGFNLLRLAAPPWVVFLAGAFISLVGWIFLGSATGILGERGFGRVFVAIGLLALALMHRVALFGQSRSAIAIGPFIFSGGETNAAAYVVLALIDGLIAVVLLTKFLPTLHRRLAPKDSVTENRLLWLGASVILFALFWAGEAIGLYGLRG